MNNILLLSKQEQSFYDEVFFAVKKGETEIAVPSGLNINKCLEIIKIVLGMNQEYFYYDNCKISYYKRNLGYVIRLSKWISVLKSIIAVEKFKSEAQRIISAVVTKDMNKFQKTLAIHNYLVDNVRYYEGNGNVFNYQQYHTAFGAIVNKCAVCEGIAAAYCYLLSLIGIKSTIVNGFTHENRRCGHSWNIIEIEEKCYHIDVTWDLKNKSNSEQFNLDYFGLKDDDLFNRSWDKTLYKKCDDTHMNFFYLTKSIAMSDNELLSICRRQIKKNRSIYIKCPYLRNITSQELLCDYVYNVIKNDSIITDCINGNLIFRVNTDQLIVRVN